MKPIAINFRQLRLRPLPDVVSKLFESGLLMLFIIYKSRLIDMKKEKFYNQSTGYILGVVNRSSILCFQGPDVKSRLRSIRRIFVFVVFIPDNIRFGNAGDRRT